MAFPVRFSDGFTPEEHGWVPAETMLDKKVWLRWEVPFLYPASISECFQDDDGRTVAWYMGPVNGLFAEQVRAGDVYAEMLRDDLNDFNQERVN